MSSHLFPEQFENLRKESLESAWDAWFEHCHGVYVSKPELFRVLAHVDEDVQLFDRSEEARGLDAFQLGRQNLSKSDWEGPTSDALDKLYYLFSLHDGYVDFIEVFTALVVRSEQLCRREKLLMIRERCMIFSELNTASVVNGARLATDGTREHPRAIISARDIEARVDQFPHKPIDIRIEIVKTGADVREELLNVRVGNKIEQFDKEGKATVHVPSNTEAVINKWKLKLKYGPFKVKGNTEFDTAEGRVVELDGLNERGDGEALEDDEEKEAMEFARQVEDASPSCFATVGLQQESTSFVQSCAPPPSPDGQELVIGPAFGYDNDVGVLHNNKGEVIYACGRYIVVQDLLNVRSAGAMAKRICTYHRDKITAMALAQNGHHVYSAQKGSRKILVWDSANLALAGCIDTVIRGPQHLCIHSGALFICSGGADRSFAFYKIDTLERKNAGLDNRVKLVYSGRIENRYTVAKARLASPDEAVLVGSHVLRLSATGRLARMRWGKYAPKCPQRDICILHNKACVTVSDEAIYLWNDDRCTNHIVPHNGNIPLCLAVQLQGSTDRFLCGMSNGTIRSYSFRELSDLKTRFGDVEPGQELGNPPGQPNLPKADPRHRGQITALFSSPSGVLASSSNGSLFALSLLQKEDPWTLLKVGHGAEQRLLWAWCGPDLIATTSDDMQIRVWILPSAPESDAQRQVMLRSRHRLMMSYSGLACSPVAIAGDRTRVFVALANRKIMALDIDAPESSSYDLIECSLPAVDQLAASDNLIAACCLQARSIEVRAFPSGKLVTKLRFNPSAKVLHSYELTFTTSEHGEPLLCFGDGQFAWNAKTWKQAGQQSNSVFKSKAEKTYVVAPSQSSIVLYMRVSLEHEALHPSRALSKPMIEECSKAVRLVPSARSRNSGARPYQRSNLSRAEIRGAGNQAMAELPAEDQLPVIVADGRLVRAVAVHPTWTEGVLAVATDQAHVQVNDYKLEIDGPAVALAFDKERRLAVATARSLAVFDWACGILVAQTRLPAESLATLALAFSQTERANDDLADALTPEESSSSLSDIIARVDGFGNIWVWKIGMDRLSLLPHLRVFDCKATSLTSSGMFGTTSGLIKSWMNPEVECKTRGQSSVLDLFEDKAGYVTGHKDGSVQLWTLNLDAVHHERIDFGVPVVSVFRNPASNSVVACLSDGSVVIKNIKIAPHTINESLMLPLVRWYTDDDASPASSPDPQTAVRLARPSAANHTIVVQPDRVLALGQPSCEFVFDDPVNLSLIALSTNRQLLAVVSTTNHLYILDANTCVLVYFWPSASIGSPVRSLAFEGRFARIQQASNFGRLPGMYGERIGEQDVPLFEGLYINGKRFVYRV